jgi:hypothetical protein
MESYSFGRYGRIFVDSAINGVGMDLPSGGASMLLVSTPFPSFLKIRETDIEIIE